MSGDAALYIHMEMEDMYRVATAAAISIVSGWGFIFWPRTDWFSEIGLCENSINQIN